MIFTPKMTNLALVFFGFVLFTRVVSSVGKSILQELVSWASYLHILGLVLQKARDNGQCSSLTFLLVNPQSFLIAPKGKPRIAGNQTREERSGYELMTTQAFSLYSRLFLSSSSARQRILRSQVLEQKSELSRTSSQDEFAKWAKLKRKVDRGMADLESISASPP